MCGAEHFPEGRDKDGNPRGGVGRGKGENPRGGTERGEKAHRLTDPKMRQK